MSKTITIKGQITIEEWLASLPKIEEKKKKNKYKTLNDYWLSKTKGNPIRLDPNDLREAQEELGENITWYFVTDVRKCCGTYPMPQNTPGFASKEYLECLCCGRKSKPVRDSDYRESRKEWEKTFAEQVRELP